MEEDSQPVVRLSRTFLQSDGTIKVVVDPEPTSPPEEHKHPDPAPLSPSTHVPAEQPAATLPDTLPAEPQSHPASPTLAPEEEPLAAASTVEELKELHASLALEPVPFGDIPQTESKETASEAPVAVVSESPAPTVETKEADADTEPEEEDFQAMSVKQLQTLCKARGLKQQGKKSELVARLLAARE